MASAIAKAEKQLRELEEKRSSIAAQLERAEAREVEVAGRLSDVDDLEARVVLGEAERKEADRLRDQVERETEKARREAKALASAAAELDRRIVSARRAVTDARREEATRQRRAAEADVQKAAGELAQRVEAAGRTAAELADARRRLDETRAAELAFYDDRDDAPAVADEPDFRRGASDVLRALLDKGPRTPNADEAADLARGAEERRQSELELINQFLRQNGFLAGFPEHLRPEAERRLAEQRAEARRRDDLELQAIRRLESRSVMATAEEITREIARIEAGG